MGMFDQSARFATKAEPSFMLARLRPLTGLTLAVRRWFEVKAVPLPGGAEREADLVAVADEPDEAKPPWLLISSSSRSTTRTNRRSCNWRR